MMDRRKIEIIRHEDHLLTVKPNDAFEDLMRSVPIYMNDNGRSRLHGYDHFNVYKYVNLEKFSTSYVGNEFASIGAFSYSYSHVSPGVSVGRYSSIAAGLRLPGPRHPVEAISTSSFVFDRNAPFVVEPLKDKGIFGSFPFGRVPPRGVGAVGK
jgi:hypothetical protein